MLERLQVQEAGPDRHRRHGSARRALDRAARRAASWVRPARRCCWRCRRRARATRWTRSSRLSRAVSPAACVLTKVDEAASLGAVISTTLRHKLRIAYLCDGQRVPEDLHSAHQRRVWLVRAALKLKEHAPPRATMAYLRTQFRPSTRPCVTPDSADRRRRPSRSSIPPRPVKVIAVTGGKGGVGKTTVSANLAVAIAAQGRDVMLVDADLGLANVDVVLGLHTRFHLGHVVSGRMRARGRHRHRTAWACRSCRRPPASSAWRPCRRRSTPASSAPSATCITASRCWSSTPPPDCTTAS